VTTRQPTGRGCTARRPGSRGPAGGRTAERSPRCRRHQAKADAGEGSAFPRSWSGGIGQHGSTSARPNELGVFRGATMVTFHCKEGPAC
jgi:hypothetical protein